MQSQKQARAEEWSELRSVKDCKIHVAHQRVKEEEA